MMAAVVAAALASPITEKLADRPPSSPSLCPLRLLLGVPCPSCGATRAGLHLLAGNVSEALAANPGATVFFLVVAVGTLLRWWTPWDLLGVAKSENPVADSDVMTTRPATSRLLVTA